MVKTFVKTVWTLLEADQDKYMSAWKAGNNTVRHSSWNKFVRDVKIAASINKVIDNVLTQHKWNLYQVMAQHETCMVNELVKLVLIDLILFTI